jgi:hypothetical protein
MKKNVGLFAILVALLGVTYFFQEKTSEKTFEENLVKDKLFPGEITQITISGLSAAKLDGKWKAGDILLSHNLLKLTEEKIHQLKKVKSISGDKENFFSSPVVFTVNNDQITLGELSLDRQSFYLSRNGEMMLAILEGTSQEIMSDEKDIQGRKLQELKALVTRKPEELYETQLFRFYPELPLERVTIKVPETLPFELDLKNNTTTPPPFPGISVHEKLSEKFMSLLSQVSLKEEIPYDKFGTKLGQITFSSEGKGVMWELYTRNPITADAVLTDPVRQKAWLMIGGTLKIFFIQLQDYWDKKNIPPDEFRPFDRTAMTLTEGHLRTIVNLINKEPLEFESTGFKVKKERMLELVTYALNLGPLDQASRVSLLSNSERKQVLSEEHLQLEIFGQELLFWVKAEELIIVNLTQGYKCHYPRGDNSGGFHFKDVLE